MIVAESEMMRTNVGTPPSPIEILLTTPAKIVNGTLCAADRTLPEPFVPSYVVSVAS